jgi:Domain of unknown function (DUF4349)
MTLTRPRLAIVGVLSLVALSGCGGGIASNTAGSAAGDNAASAPRADSALGNTGSAQQAFTAKGPAVEVVQKAVSRNGDIEIRTSDPQRARDRVDGLLNRLDGSIDDEQTVYDNEGHIHDSQLVLRVPVDSFTRAVDDLEQLGTVVHSSSSGKDVTTEVIDVQQRLKTLRISLHDLNSFQRRASTIDQLLRFENAITQRRGEYQSLKAQRDHLVNETSMSTISLDISVPPTHASPTSHHHHAGFVTGLRHGWSALIGTVLVALTAVGALLPFAVLLVVIGLPLWWWSRRMGRSRPTPAPADAPSD